MRIIKSNLVITLFAVVFLLQMCKPAQTSQSSTAPKATAAIVSYEKNIRPLMVERCTPCHFPQEGKKKMLDTFAATKTEANEIITRIEMSPDEIKFMPFKNKKPALTKEEIQLFKEWVKQGMPN